MPNLFSHTKHALPYAPPKDNARRLKEVELLLQTIVEMPLHMQTKKIMLNRTLWLVVELSGNFNCRYRSEGVLSKVGERIQRDHIYTRKSLVDMLLKPSPDYEEIINKAVCCVVTPVEHKKLSDVPKSFEGFDRYKEAEVVYYDMTNYQKTEF